MMGKKTFSMQVLDDLVLTEGTRLFKAALFLRGSTDDFTGVACDSQLGISANNHMALFWLNFLGCKFIVDPRVSTQRFFDATLAFVSQTVSDPTIKGQIYDALHSEYKSAKLTFSPKKFIEEYVPTSYQPVIKEYFEEEGVALSQFHKDTSNIERRLQVL